MPDDSPALRYYRALASGWSGWLGAELVQTTQIVPEGLRLEQSTPWSRAAVVLVRSERV